MAFKDALDGRQRSNRAERCRVCVLIEELPEPDASDLAHAIRVGSGYGLKRVVDALDAEYPDPLGWYHSAKHHRYICAAKP